MAEIKNTFLKQKMNQDIDSRLLPNGEYREAINLMISRSEGSTVGEFENALGNTSIRSLNGDNAVIIGHYVNETTNKVYLFATDYNEVNGVRSVGAENFIYELTLEGSFNLVTLVTGNFLNFNQSFPVIGINLVEDLLFFTDNLNQPRKINISLANPSQLTVPTHYTNEDQISVAKYAPCEPVVVMDRINIRLTVAAVGLTTSITVDTVTGLKIGDFISPFETINPSAFPAPLSQWNKANKIIAITGNVLTLSEGMTAPNSFKLIAQRSTMTNKTSVFDSNGAQVTATVAGNNPVALTATYTFSVLGTNFSPDIIPSPGDIVTGTGISANTTILTATATQSVTNLDQNFVTWVVTLSKTTTIANGSGNVIQIAINPDYDAGWQGDAAFLEDKFVRFSYRFKFEDNEYSLMAPFSQPMFIPKQYSEFGGGQNPDFVDMDNAYKSTVVNWFENNIDNIVLKAPMPYNNPQTMLSSLLATEIDLLYKESDALAVKVLDTVKFVDLASNAFSSIIYVDPVHGDNVNQFFYNYNYSSNKPYKTLPENQTTRVYDKVPIKALAQEMIGNRVVYGNYVDKHSSPDSIPFSALISDKRPYNDNFIQYPYHNLKQNRTYQVGFVLSDRYGRQSDVILSSYDNVDGINGSTVFAPYNTITEQINNPIIDWLGTSLNIRIDSAIGQATTGGQPGIWNATTNPLGWYSYKVVVKQQEQEYYNVYLPGFVNGLPITETDEENKSSFSVLLSDNINKVPRNLQEVGPTDTEYSSSEMLYIRINNPNINKKLNRPYGYPLKTSAWNQQYYPGFLNQEVLSIATVKDMEISGIPFKANAPEGDYGQTGTFVDTSVTPNVTAPVSIGSIPWGTSPVLQPFYNSDLNPFAIKIDTTANGKVALATTVPIVPGGVGADTNAEDGTGSGGVITMQPFLSVAETKPVYSLLEIFWETSLQGKINTLNSLINSQYAGITTISSSAATFLESAATATQIGNSLTFATGGGTTVEDASHLTVTLLSAFRQSDVTQSTDVKSNFDLALKSGQALAVYDLDTATTFFYSNTSQANPSTDVYDITIKTVYDNGSGDPGFPFTDTHSYVATLGNVAPSFTTSSMNPTGITIASTTIKQYAAVNGTAKTANNTDELVFTLGSGNPSSVTNQFTMSSSGLLSTNSALTEGDTWVIIITVTDVNGSGISTNATITFTVGVQHVPQAICNNNQLSSVAACTQSYEAFFGASSSTSSTGSYGTIGGIFYPGNAIQFYNVRANFTNATTGALTQGVMALTPLLTSTNGASGGNLSVYYTVQYRANTSSSWSQAVDTGGNSISSRQITATNGNPGTETLNFSIPGEYRAFSTNVTGEGCAGNTGGFKFNFTDATYNGQCALGPL